MTKQQANLVKIIHREMQEWYDQLKDEKGSIGSYCLWWTYFTVKVLNRARIPARIPAQLQAGTAYWHIVTPSQDDGISPNSFGYKFNYDTNAILRLMQGVLPEMHVWTAIAPDTIIDVTTTFWPSQCQQLINVPWKTPKPPYCLWTNKLPKDVTYQADIHAIQLTYQIIKNQT